MSIQPTGTGIIPDFEFELELEIKPEEEPAVEPEVTNSASAYKTIQVDVNGDGYKDTITYDPKLLQGSTFNPAVDIDAVVDVQLGGVPVPAGEPHDDNWYPTFTTFPVTPQSLEYLAADPKFAAEMAKLHPPVSEAAYAEVVVSGVDCFVRTYTADQLGPNGQPQPGVRGYESNWLRGALGNIGGDIGADPAAVLGKLKEQLGPRTDMVKAVDLSYGTGMLTQAEVDELKAMGVTHAIIGTQDPEISRQQMALLNANGITTDAYVYIYWDQDIDAQIAKAVETFKDFPVGTFYLDLEDEGSFPPGTGAGDRIAQVQEAVNKFNAMKEQLGLETEVGIYTSWGFWTSYMDNTTQFKDLPLWYAHWPHNGQVDQSQFNAQNIFDDWYKDADPNSGFGVFGGWTDPVGRQFSGTQNMSTGADYDLDYMYLPDNQRDQTFPAEVPEEPEVPKDVNGQLQV